MAVTEITFEEIVEWRSLGCGMYAAAYEHPTNENIVYRVEYLEQSFRKTLHHESILAAKEYGFPVVPIIDSFVCESNSGFRYECLVKPRVQLLNDCMLKDGRDKLKKFHLMREGTTNSLCPGKEVFGEYCCTEEEWYVAVSSLRLWGSLEPKKEWQSCRKATDLHNCNVCVNQGQIQILDLHFDEEMI